jgi:cytochrome c peroxidase
VRLLVFAAASIAMGMQADEFVWRIPGGEQGGDLDGDGVTGELSVGDVTAITVYTAGLSTPQELADLADAGVIEPPSATDLERVERGREIFAEIGCTSCHVPEMHLESTIFEEPTARGNGNFHDPFLAERDPDYDPSRPVRFDLLSDSQPPHAEAHPDGGAIVRLYGDLKRHSMGRHLAEPDGPSAALTPALAPTSAPDGQPVMIAPDVFLTAELWGVGNTGPWLHDGRAGTLREAVLLHGEDAPPARGEPGRSEAQESRDAFVGLSDEAQGDLVALLLSLRTYAPDDGP